ncbi:MAG: hypothetical protein IT260_08600 [Saprospiraceae bacterium]|nr:hypothetical protein [Saprospiraceae bacterium]
MVPYCLEFLKSKSGNKPLRAYFFKKTYDYHLVYPEIRTAIKKFPLPERLFTQKLPFVFEIVIVIQYLHNQILDEKYEIRRFNHGAVCRNLISSNILREALFLYLEQEIAPLLHRPEQFQVLQATVRKLLLWVDLGQRIDKEYNHYQHWKAGSVSFTVHNPILDHLALETIGETIRQVQKDIPGKEEFVMAYFQRIYLTNVYFFRCMAELLFDLCEYEGPQATGYQQFTMLYGYMLQIINDYADFAYTDDPEEREKLKASAKSTTDFFSDLYNFNITLPLIYHLAEGGRRNIEAYLEGGVKRKKLLTLYPRQIMQEIVKSGGIHAAIRISRECSKSAETFLDDTNPATPYFRDMCAMAMFNKFYKIFK